MTLVKICGLSTAPTVAAALDAGADMVGFVFYPRSPRNVSVEAAAALAAPARGRALVVALCVDGEDDALGVLAAQLRPDLLQLHGGESVDRVRDIRARFGVPVMKAVGVREAADVARAAAYAGVADRIMLDAKPPADPSALPGGNGLAFDWRLAADLSQRFPFMLSGGLTPDTVGAAIRLTAPDAVDVSSGVERAPGVKDPARIRAFVAAARAADAAKGNAA
jgi:phosphoribosylanthranilate isomerase